MLRRVVCSLLLAALVFVAPVAVAAKTPTPKAVKPGDRLLAAVQTASASAAPAGGEQLTQIRWASHTDAATGASRLRLVIDATGPVQIKAVTSGLPTPRLIVDVKGAVPGQTNCNVALDGKIADSVSMAADNGLNTKVIVELPLMVDEGEYKVFTLPKDPANNKPFRVVIDINKPLPPVEFKFTAGLKNKLIVLDPGHGGTDPGAIGPGGAREKDVNLAVALRVRALLEKAGAKVIMTRENDSDVFGPNATDRNELKARATIANVKKADVFLSIHSNAAPNAEAGGTSTYFYQKTRYDSLLARNVQAAMAEMSGLKDRGVVPANLYVTKYTVMPAALAELAFLSNPAEESLLVNPPFQQKMAEGIVRGLENFFAQAAKMGGE